MFCANCGEKIEDGAKFCGKCGWKVETAGTSQAQEAAVAETAEETAVTETAVAEEAVKEEAATAVPVPEAPVAEETPVEETPKTEAPAEAVPAEETPKTEKKKKGKLILIPVVLLALIGIVVGVVLFLNGLKREEIDLADVVSFQVTGYSGYGVAEVVLNEDMLEDEYEDAILEHTELRWSKFVKEVDLLEYEVTDLAGLSNGDKIVLTWTCDKDKASEEYKVDILGETVEYTVTGLPEIAKVDPFEDFTVTFSGISGEGIISVDTDGYQNYFDFFYYSVSQWSELSNGDTVTISFDVSQYKDYVAEKYGYVLSATEKSYTVSGLTEYVGTNAQVEAQIKPLMAKAEEYFYSQINGWVDEASVKNLECVGQFISKPESLSSGTKNVVGLIYKVNANLFIEERNLDVEYYYPVLFRNVIVLEDGSLSYSENDMSRTSDRFTKQYEPENEEDVVPSGNWYFYGYETLDALKDAYRSYSISWNYVETETFVEKNYTKSVNGSLKGTDVEKVKNGNPDALVEDAIASFLDSIESWKDTASVNGVKCVETKLYCSDIATEALPTNCYEVILQVDAKLEYEDMTEEFPFYYVVRYQNVTVGANGALTADLTTRTTANGEFKKMLGEKEIYKGWFSAAENVWLYYGYETLEEAKAFEEIRNKNLFYVLKASIPYEADAAADMAAWGNADDSAVVEAAVAAFRETGAEWPESATVNSIECVDTYLISCGIASKEKELAVLLKVNAEVAFADHSEAFDYYYMVRFGKAQLDANGAITVDETTKVLTDNPFTRMLGDEEVPGEDGAPLNVWNFSGYATTEEAEATILSKREAHINYAGVKVPEPVVEEPPVEEPSETPGAEGDAPEETPGTEGDAPIETPEDVLESTEGEE